MKSMEDLNLMTVPMLEKIHLDLTGNKPRKGLTKQQLVLSVFDLQQPDPVASEALETPESDEDATPLDDNAPADKNSFDLVGDEEDLIGEAPAKVAVLVSSTDAKPAEVERALSHLPLQLAFDETGLTITKGGKSIYTTIRQPLHVIVATAEAFAGVR